MITYRTYNDKDYAKYKTFCERNWGKFCHQSKHKHIKWLLSYPSHFINIAVDAEKILGCFHGFHAPVKISEKTEYFYSLHDLMVDKDHRSGIGLKLMQNSIFQDRPVILSGVLEEVSKAYRSLGAKKFKSHWYRKFIFPKNIHNSYLINFQKVQLYQQKVNFDLVNNKEESSRIKIEEILDLYDYSNSISKYFEWRFFHQLSPLTFFMSHDKNIILFSLGRKKFVSFLRIISVIKSDDEVFIQMLKALEKFSSLIGASFILYTITEDIPPPKQLNYKIYKKIPNSFLYSREKNNFYNVYVNGFSTDSGFESYFFNKYA